MDSQKFQVFVQGVNQVFSTWFASKKKDELIQEVIMLFQSGKKVNSIDLANFLMEVMESRFSAIVEDESDLEVAELICELYETCSKGDFSLVEKIMNIKKTSLDSCKMQSYILDEDGAEISDLETDENGEEF
ncbi:Pre-rRNA-processing protein TSR2 [Cryptosporidium felis]|nr:Pre-rRNA-processing protein TSR2 [Cryptosporidium felis]